MLEEEGKMYALRAFFAFADVVRLSRTITRELNVISVRVDVVLDEDGGRMEPDKNYHNPPLTVRDACARGGERQARQHRR